MTYLVRLSINQTENDMYTYIFVFKGFVISKKIAYFVRLLINDYFTFLSLIIF